MQRPLILLLMILVVVLACTLAFILLRAPSQLTPISIGAAEENAIEPLQREMDCIDRVLQNNELNGNEVEPALANCRAESGGSAARH